LTERECMKGFLKINLTKKTRGEGQKEATKEESARKIPVGRITTSASAPKKNQKRS